MVDRVAFGLASTGPGDSPPAAPKDAREQAMPGDDLDGEQSKSMVGTARRRRMDLPEWHQEGK